MSPVNRDSGRLTASGGWIAPRSALDTLGITITDQETPMNTPRTYVKKPVAIEAIQWDGTATGATPIINWILDNGGTATYHCENVADCAHDDHTLLITTLEGNMRADALDWIIKGVQGEFYPCKGSIFRETYEEQA